MIPSGREVRVSPLPDGGGGAPLQLPIADGVLLMAYGAPATLDDVADSFTHIRDGRRPPPERVEELVGRYRQIGDVSRLLKITEEQGRALQERLDTDAGPPVRVFTGMRHSPPFIADRVSGIAASGVRHLVGLVLAPHYSSMSVGKYHAILRESLGALASPPSLIEVKSYHDHEGFIAAVVEALREALADVRRESGEEPPPRVIFTAHSLPARILDEGDPYRDQVETTARLAAAAAGVDRWEVAFQSASPTGEPWLGPDFIERIRACGEAGERGVIVAPIGFVSEHLEILYDVDILARKAAAAAGVRLWRTPSMNTRPDFVGALASIVREALANRLNGRSAS